MRPGIERVAHKADGGTPLRNGKPHVPHKVMETPDQRRHHFREPRVGVGPRGGDGAVSEGGTETTLWIVILASSVIGIPRSSEQPLGHWNLGMKAFQNLCQSFQSDF